MSEANIELWQIIVPTIRKDGRFISTRCHKVFDKFVYDKTGGITIQAVSRGKWVAPNKDLCTERVIPVLIACTREQIDQITDFMIKHYDQMAILAWKVSSEVIFKYAK